MTQHFYSSTSVATALSDALTSGGTQFNVPSVAGDNGWPTSFPFTLAIDYGTANQELVDVTSKAGLLTLPSRQVWVVTRGVDGTTAVSHSAGATVQHVIAARDLTEASTLLYNTPMPLGIVAYNQSNAPAGSATTVEILALSVSATLSSTRAYRIWTSILEAQSSASGDFMNVALLSSGAGGTLSNASTQLTVVVMECPLLNAIKDGKAINYLLNAPTSGLYQFGLYVVRNSGGGTVVINASGARPVQFIIEDIGPAEGSTSP